jgi:hypothetical protein
VFALIICKKTHLMIAGLLGALLLVLFNVSTLQEAIAYISRCLTRLGGNGTLVGASSPRDSRHCRTARQTHFV